MHWHFSNGYTALGGLSLVVGVAVAETLKQLDIDWIKLKWPNDIYAQGKKLAGVLIEVEGSLQAGCDTTIGIGLNIALPKKVEEIGQPWIDLTHICDTPIDRNILAARLIDQLYSTLEQFEMKGLAPFLEKWAALDQYKDQPIKLLMGKQTIQGVGKGIDHTGALLLETSKGIQAFHGGEISVRPV